MYAAINEVRIPITPPALRTLVFYEYEDGKSINLYIENTYEVEPP
jgi:hypothetical protein